MTCHRCLDPITDEAAFRIEGWVAGTRDDFALCGPCLLACWMYVAEASQRTPPPNDPVEPPHVCDSGQKES